MIISHLKFDEMMHSNPLSLKTLISYSSVKSLVSFNSEKTIM